jgi:hypothetical protein
MFFHDMIAAHPEFAHMRSIVDSVLDSNVDSMLAACTSMHDLTVVTSPPPAPPYDVIRVCSPSSLRPVAPGTVLIEHLAATGNNAACCFAKKRRRRSKRAALRASRKRLVADWQFVLQRHDRFED